jgi:hypothetical protein
VCGRRRLVRQDGLVRKHYVLEGFDLRDGDDNPLCAGSDHQPRETLAEQYFCNVGCSGCQDVIDYGI